MRADAFSLPSRNFAKLTKSISIPSGTMLNCGHLIQRSPHAAGACEASLSTVFAAPCKLGVLRTSVNGRSTLAAHASQAGRTAWLTSCGSCTQQPRSTSMQEWVAGRRHKVASWLPLAEIASGLISTT